MKDTKKAALSGQDQERHDQTECIPNTESFQQNCNTRKGARQVSTLLQHGERNAVSSAYLIETLGLSSQRELRHIIARERESGEIILSNSKGYYLPSSGEEGLQEIRNCVRILRAKGISTLRAAAAIKKPLREVYGQRSMDDLDTDVVLPEV